MKKNYYGKKRIITAVAVAAMIVVLCVGVGAKNYLPVFSSQWREQISENVSKAASAEGIEAFDKKISKSEDMCWTQLFRMRRLTEE